MPSRLATANHAATGGISILDGSRAQNLAIVMSKITQTETSTEENLPRTGRLRSIRGYLGVVWCG